MASQTISVKYIPNTSIDYFNSLISAIETPGSLLTLHVESFSCRVSRADKQNFENQRRDHMVKGNMSNAGTQSVGNNTYNGTTPTISYGGVNSSVTPQHRFTDAATEDDFRLDDDAPVSGQSQQTSTFPATFSTNFGGGMFGADANGLLAGTPPTTPPLSFLSPSTGTAISTGTTSGRPCFPEYFVVPNGMGSAVPSASDAEVGGGGVGGGSGAASGGGGAEGTTAPVSGGYQQQRYHMNGMMPSFSLDADSLPPTMASNSSNKGASGTLLNSNGRSGSTGGGGGGMGGRSASTGMGGRSGSNGAQQQPSSVNHYVPSTPEEAYAYALQIISDRLIFLVGALNSLYGTSEYDFSVLEARDFLLVNPIAFINDVNEMLSKLPASVLQYTGQQGEAFWRAIGSMVGGEQAIYDAASNMSECDVFLFKCPQCDPTAQTKLWSTHYFIYNKKNRVVVSVLGFGEGNLYRGEQLGFMGSGGQVSSSVINSHQYASDHHHHHSNLPTEASNGEYYTDSYGNTHCIGGDYDDDDDDAASTGGYDQRSRGGYGGSSRGRYGRGGADARTYGNSGADTPQYAIASMTDASDWGGDDVN